MPCVGVRMYGQEKNETNQSNPILTFIQSYNSLFNSHTDQRPARMDLVAVVSPGVPVFADLLTDFDEMKLEPRCMIIDPSPGRVLPEFR